MAALLYNTKHIWSFVLLLLVISCPNMELVEVLAAEPIYGSGIWTTLQESDTDRLLHHLISIHPNIGIHH